MPEGLLLYDDDSKATLTEKIARGVAFYHKKYGSLPGVCYVHPAVAANNGEVKQVGDVRVVALSTVLLHHYWLCPDEESKKAPPKTKGVIRPIE